MADDSFSFHCTTHPTDQQNLHIVSIGGQAWRSHSHLLRRGHHCHLLMCTLSGAVTEKVNDDPIYAEENSIWIFPRNKTYTYSWDPQLEEWSYVWIEFEGSWASPLLEMMQLHKQHHFHNCTASRHYVDQLIQLLRKQGNSGQHQATALLWSVFAHMEENLVNPKRSKQPRSTDAVAKKYMADHLTETINLEDIASHAKMSPFHFSRVFKQQNGVAPMKYLRQLRVARAKALFNRHDMNTSEVGVAVGYPIIQHFSRMFKAETGMTPRDYINSLH